MCNISYYYLYDEIGILCWGYRFYLTWKLPDKAFDTPYFMKNNFRVAQFYYLECSCLIYFTLSQYFILEFIGALDYNIKMASLSVDIEWEHTFFSLLIWLKLNDNCVWFVFSHAKWKPPIGHRLQYVGWYAITSLKSLYNKKKSQHFFT